MAIGTTSSQGGLLEKTLPGLALIKARRSILKDLVGKRYSVDKKYVRQYIKMSAITSQHNSVEGGPIGPPKTPNVVESRAYPTVFVASASITDLLAEAESEALTGPKVGASNVAKFYIKDLLNQGVWYENFMCLRDGSGVVSLLGTTTSGTSILVTDGRGLLEDATYEIRAGSARGTIAVGDVLATFTVARKARIPSTGGQALIYPTATIPNNGQIATDYISWGAGNGSSYGKAMTGLSALIDDAAATFQYVNCSTYPQWTSVVYDNGGTTFNLNPQIMRQVMGMIMLEGDDAEFEAAPKARTIMAPVEIQAGVEAMYESALQVSPGTATVGIGSGGTKFRSALGAWNIKANRYMPYHMMFFADPGQIVQLVWQPLRARHNRSLNDAFKDINATLGKTAEFSEASNLMIIERNSCARIENVAMTPFSTR